LFDRVRVTVLREFLVWERVRRHQRLDDTRLEGELHGVPGQVISAVPLSEVEQGLRLFQSRVGELLEFCPSLDQLAQRATSSRLWQSHCTGSPNGGVSNPAALGLWNGLHL